MPAGTSSTGHPMHASFSNQPHPPLSNIVAGNWKSGISEREMDVSKTTEALSCAPRTLRDENIESGGASYRADVEDVSPAASPATSKNDGE